MHFRILFFISLLLFSALHSCQSDAKNKVEEKEITLKNKGYGVKILSTEYL